VQLGAYRDPANVRNLTAKLKQQGYNFYTEALPSPDGSSRTRVRAGPFPSKEAAEAARERIKRIGVDGVVAQK
jgi:DedD protein